jgi:hypothetical protein
MIESRWAAVKQKVKSYKNTLLTRHTVSFTGCQLLDELSFVRIVFWTNWPIG